jgi:ABC-type Na+ transport system ATPase subunit NatA
VTKRWHGSGHPVASLDRTEEGVVTVVSPREQFSVGVAQDPNGAANGVGVTSARQPLVDDLTVRQIGAIAFALSGLVNDRITAQQEQVFLQAKQLPKADLDKLARLDVAQSDQRAGSDDFD